MPWKKEEEKRDTAAEQEEEAGEVQEEFRMWEREDMKEDTEEEEEEEVQEEQNPKAAWSDQLSDEDAAKLPMEKIFLALLQRLAQYRTEHNIPFAANVWEMNKLRQVMDLAVENEDLPPDKSSKKIGRRASDIVGDAIGWKCENSLGTLLSSSMTMMTSSDPLSHRMSEVVCILKLNLDDKIQRITMTDSPLTVARPDTPAQRFFLDDLSVGSAQMQNWWGALGEVFVFMAEPGSAEFKKGGTEIAPELAVLFEKIDEDQDSLISFKDATSFFGGAQLAEVFMHCFAKQPGMDGIAWPDFIYQDYEGGAWGAGTMWMELLEATHLLPEKKLDSALRILQRHSIRPFIEAGGLDTAKPNDDGDTLLGVDRSEIDHEQIPGLGVLLGADSTGKPVVLKVARPGPADGLLWKGDVIHSIKGGGQDQKLTTLSTTQGVLALLGAGSGQLKLSPAR
ncbi:hypothetical protein T484DRAFT_1762040 [Baffinella frigidus]|nr:hypothetical protein T484DRAFT_1762040 [Cryptophyta sp. CCMP2293]